MSWAALAVAFAGSHLAGDFLVQTDWQALTKPGGLGRDTAARRALFSHLLTYLVCFVPALVWIASHLGAGAAVGAAAAVAVPHALVDDGRLVAAWLHGVKRAPEPSYALMLMVDQSMHALCLLGLALALAA